MNPDVRAVAVAAAEMRERIEAHRQHGLKRLTVSLEQAEEWASALESASQWRPIADAPHADAVRILLLLDSGDAVVGEWSQQLRIFVWDNSGWNARGKATHWTTLPDPPKEATR